MDEIVAFLSRMLDAEEATARAATPGPWRWKDPGGKVKQALVGDRGLTVVPSALGDVYPSVHDATHIVRHDPARMLADVAAKRAILNRAVRMVDSFNAAPDAPWPDASRRERSHAVETIHDLAAPYDGHPDFDPAWRVT